MGSLVKASSTWAPSAGRRLFHVGAGTPPNANLEVVILVGPHQRKATIWVSWEQTIRNYLTLAKDHKNGLGKLIFDYLTEGMKADWYRNWEGKDEAVNEYVDTEHYPNNLAVQWLRVLRSLTPVERAKLAHFKDDLIDALGGRPGMMRAAITKKRYDDLVQLLNASFK